MTAKLPGIALSAILLSLGAPFWYNALKDLVGLRPILARKEQAHREQKRDNGDPYIVHPLAVADILAGYGLDEASIATALLHAFGITLGRAIGRFDEVPRRRAVQVCGAAMALIGTGLTVGLV